MGTKQLWNAVALSSDVAPGMVSPASLKFGPIAVWRGRSGQIAANHDRCPHRGMRLSHGFVRGDTLSCIYHGWSFAQDGRCTSIPAHPNLEPPASIHCGALPAVEAHGVIWVSAKTSEQGPPTCEGFEGFRCLDVACSQAVFDRATGFSENDEYLTLNVAGFEARVFVSETEGSGLRLFVLVREDLGQSDRVAVSRGLEQFRMTCEAST